MKSEDNLSRVLTRKEVIKTFQESIRKGVTKWAEEIDTMVFNESIHTGTKPASRSEKGN